MSSISIYNYVYRITNHLTGMHYYGVRSSKVQPKLDLGVKYKSSSSDKAFIQEQRTNPQNFRYKIVRQFETRKEAMACEIKLHNKFEVGKNPKFYNKAKQTSTGFSGTEYTEERRLKIANSSMDHIIYTFYHEDGLNFTGKRYAFRSQYSLSESHVAELVSGKRKNVNGWSMSKEEAVKRIHKFYHKDGDIFTGKQHEFCLKYSLGSANVSQLAKGKSKNHSGWRI